MTKFQTFQEFLATQSISVPILDFVVNLLLAGALCYLLSCLYVRWGASLSDRKRFARNFVLVGMTTMVIITIVKSSLALSLGLVGALSIVRFRSAIKEPEELAYLFLTIAVGLGFGAGQRMITVVGFGIICSLLVLKSFPSKKADFSNLFLTVTSQGDSKVALEPLVSRLKLHCSSIDLKRFDETKDLLEASFLVSFENFEKMSQGKESLRELDESVRVTFLDNQNLLTT